MKLSLTKIVLLAATGNMVRAKEHILENGFLKPNVLCWTHQFLACEMLEKATKIYIVVSDSKTEVSCMSHMGIIVTQRASLANVRRIITKKIVQDFCQGGE